MRFSKVSSGFCKIPWGIFIEVKNQSTTVDVIFQNWTWNIPIVAYVATPSQQKSGLFSPPLILSVYILSNSNMSHHSSTSLSRFNCCILSFELVKDKILYSPSTILSQSKIMVDEVFVYVPLSLSLIKTFPSSDKVIISPLCLFSFIAL